MTPLGPTERAALLAAVAPFAVEDRARTWRLLLSTLALQAVAMTGTALAPLVLKPVGVVLIALLMVRLFMFVHDAEHDAIFVGSPLGRALVWIVGIYTLNAPPLWREGHGLHHQTNAQPLAPPLDRYQTAQLINRMLDVASWRQLGPRERLRYRLVRSPLLVLLAWFLVFAVGSCLVPFFREPRRGFWGPVTLAAYAGGCWALAQGVGWSTVGWVVVLPNVLGSVLGVYLFVAQHRYPDAVLAGTPDRPDLVGGALHGSSFFEMSPWMAWFTGNIGYHHVHHLNHRIPFYRLPEAMAAVPALQVPGRTSFSLADIAGVWRSHLWDADAGRVVSFAEAERAPG